MLFPSIRKDSSRSLRGSAGSGFPDLFLGGHSSKGSGRWRRKQVSRLALPRFSEGLESYAGLSCHPGAVLFNDFSQLPVEAPVDDRALLDLLDPGVEPRSNFSRKRISRICA